MWMVNRVCTECFRTFYTAENSMRKLCRVCIKHSGTIGVTKSHPTLRDAYLLRTYNITEAAYNKMLKMQGGKCAICGKPPKPGARLHVDHDHTEHRVRGLLCTGCNTRLGWLENNSQAIAMYLRRTK